MQLEARKYLFDIKQATDLIDTFCAGKSFADYQRDPMFRSAVERQFEIIGEAISRLAQLNPRLAEKLTEYRRIIAFRNFLILSAFICVHLRLNNCQLNLQSAHFWPRPKRSGLLWQRHKEPRRPGYSLLSAAYVLPVRPSPSTESCNLDLAPHDSPRHALSCHALSVTSALTRPGLRPIM